MITKIIYIFVCFIFLISFSQTLTLASYLIGKQSKIGDLSKNIMTSVFPLLYTKGFNSSIYYSGNYIKTDKIDIIVSNHISSVDFMLFTSLIRQYDDRNIYVLIKKNIVFTPGLGFIALSALDIKLNRKIEDDESNIIAALKKIKSGIIVIMPEGTRYTPEKYKSSQEYSISNNLHIFKNTLYPKMKGLWTICNILTKENRMGNIIDLTIMIEKLRGKKGYIKQVLTTEFGNTYGVINTYTLPKSSIESSDQIRSYDTFKTWFIDIWKKKDNILDRIQTPNEFIYSKLNHEFKSSEYILLVFIVSLFIYLILQTNGMYLVYSLGISYIITLLSLYKNK